MRDNNAYTINGGRIEALILRVIMTNVNNPLPKAVQNLQSVSLTISHNFICNKFRIEIYFIDQHNVKGLLACHCLIFLNINKLSLTLQNLKEKKNIFIEITLF